MYLPNVPTVSHRCLWREFVLTINGEQNTFIEISSHSEHTIRFILNQYIQRDISEHDFIKKEKRNEKRNFRRYDEWFEDIIVCSFWKVLYGKFSSRLTPYKRKDFTYREPEESINQ